MRGTLQYSLLFWGLLALSSQDDMAPLAFRFFLNNPLLQALGLVEEKPGKQEHRHQHKGAQHHQPHVAAVGERGPGWLLCRDHVGQVQHVAQGPTCITAANLKQKSRISAGRLGGCLGHSLNSGSPGPGCVAEAADNCWGRALPTTKRTFPRKWIICQFCSVNP